MFACRQGKDEEGKLYVQCRKRSSDELDVEGDAWVRQYFESKGTSSKAVKRPARERLTQPSSSSSSSSSATKGKKPKKKRKKRKKRKKKKEKRKSKRNSGRRRRKQEPKQQ